EHELDFEQDTDGSESDSKSDQQDDDDEDKDDDEDDDNDDDQSKGDEDRGMDSDDVQDKKADVRMTDAQQENENLEITQEQVIKDSYVKITKKTDFPFTSSSRSSDLASRTPRMLYGLVKSYNIDKDFFSIYDVYSLKSCQDDKDKDEGPCAGSDRGLKKQKISKDAEPTTSLKTKDSSSRSSKGTKSQHKSFGKSVHVEEPVFEVGDTDTPQGQEGNQGNDNVEPRIESASKRNWSQNLHVLKNSLIPTRMKTRPLRKDQLKTG
nr:hypothetical protein [Tanacetum cinerariifolium]